MRPSSFFGGPDSLVVRSHRPGYLSYIHHDLHRDPDNLHDLLGRLLYSPSHRDHHLHDADYHPCHIHL